MKIFFIGFGQAGGKIVDMFLSRTSGSAQKVSGESLLILQELT